MHGNFNLIPDHVRPCRVPGFLGVREGDDTVFRSRHAVYATLNASAFVIWSFCDGVSSVAQIERILSSEFQETRTQVGTDVRDVLAYLRDIGVLDLTGSRLSNAHLRISFCNFGPEFKRDDNYFNWMLTEHFDVLVVDPREETPDIVFFSDQPSLDVDHRQIDDSETLKIFVGGSLVEPDAAYCDYAFSTCSSELAALGDQCFLPAWATSVDWQGSQGTPHGLSFRRLIQPKHPIQGDEQQHFAYFCGTFQGVSLPGDDELSRALRTKIAPLVALRVHAGGADLIQAMSRCKFVLVRGSQADPETAEIQLLQALCSEALPIYCGDAALSEEFNRAAFIDRGAFDSVEACVEHIKRVNEDTGLYREYMSQPPLHEHLARRHAPEAICDEFYRALFDSTDHAMDRPTPPARKRPQRTLTIGMATYDDYDGVYFSVQAIRLFHPEVTEETDILVVDNNPAGTCATALKDLEHHVDGYRCISYDECVGTGVRDQIFWEAETDYVLCMDSHVLLARGALRSLLDFFRENAATSDLLQGPLVSDDLRSVATHLDAVWRGGMFGTWSFDNWMERTKHGPFEIPMQGLGVFSCRRDAWLGFNPRFTGFGGEEGYIHEKFRQAGQRVLCLPELRWLHRFRRPFGHRYPGRWKDRIRNYLIGFDELGMSYDDTIEHFRRHLGRQHTDAVVSKVMQELASPFHFFDAIYCINLDSDVDRWNAMEARFDKLGIRHRVRRFSAVETSVSHHVGCALSHRRVIERAYKQRLRNVLVFEDDAIFLDDLSRDLSTNIDELRRQSWNVFYLGGHRWGKSFPKAPGCEYIEQPGILTCTHAVAYNHTIYGRILNEIPDDVESVVKWRERYRAIDQYLLGIEGRYAAFPPVASQPSIVAQELLGYQERYS